jgi:MurNAc alpha-1-phosphate uridylyltransferase
LGVPTVQFAADLLSKAGVQNVVGNVHWLLEDTEKRLGELDWGGANFSVSRETAEILGGAGGAVQALPKLGSGPFFYVNGDVLCDADLGALAHRHQQLAARHGVQATLLLCERGMGGSGSYREVNLDAQGERIRAFGEVKKNVPYFAGVMVMDPKLLAGLTPGKPAEMFDLVLKPAAAKGLLGVHMHHGLWIDVGDVGLWRDAHLQLAERHAAGRLPAPWARRLSQAIERGLGGGFRLREAAAPPQGAQWHGPYFWAGTGLAPPKIQPGAVFYGEFTGGAVQTLGPGMGWNGIWKTLPSP